MKVSSIISFNIEHDNHDDHLDDDDGYDSFIMRISVIIRNYLTILFRIVTKSS